MPMTEGWPSVVWTLLRMGLLVYVGFLALLMGCQRHFIYYPVRGSEAELSAMAGRLGLAAWRDADGQLIGWRTRRALLAPPRFRALIFHGNAGFALHRTYFVDGFSAVGEGLAWEVLLFEYPGYGARPGHPSEQTFKQAAEAAARLLLAENDRPLFLVGESLGCAVATHLARQFPDRIAGLFLVTPFTRLTDVAAHHYPLFPIRWLMRDRYDAMADLAGYKGPLAVRLAGHDEVVPVRFGQRLFEGYTGPKRLWMESDSTHNTLDYDPQASWWREVVAFLLEQRINAPPPPGREKGQGPSSDGSWARTEAFTLFRVAGTRHCRQAG